MIVAGHGKRHEWFHSWPVGIVLRYIYYEGGTFPVSADELGMDVVLLSACEHAVMKASRHPVKATTSPARVLLERLLADTWYLKRNIRY